MNKQAYDLVDFLKRAYTPFHAVKALTEILSENHFLELRENEKWNIKKGGKYFVTRNSSSVIAFVIPEDDKKVSGYRAVASHSDSPGFKLKPDPVIDVEGEYSVLGVENYGSAIYTTWMDRPLSVAGRVIVRGKDSLEEKLVNVDRDMLVIPNAPIHFNREVNKGHNYNPAKDMRPVYGKAGSSEKFKEEIAESAGVLAEDVLCSDLFLYQRGAGCVWGAENEFISSPKLDDLACAYGSLMGFIEAEDFLHPSFDCVFDNEETGSGTRQGAASLFFYDTLRRVNEILGIGYEEYQMDIADGFMISADNAHALHPNYSEYADKNNRPVVNGGVSLKFNAPQKYATDGISGAFFADLCKSAGVKFQSYTNRADLPGGSTLGNISSLNVPLATCDIGLPQFAMHSSYETCGREDYEDYIKIVKHFYEQGI